MTFCRSITILAIAAMALSISGLWQLSTADAALQLTAPSFQGKVSYSADGLGQVGTGATVEAQVPAGSTVLQAYLHGAYFSNPIPAGQLAINFDGTAYNLTQLPSSLFLLSTARADVTSQVSAKVAGGPGPLYTFQINSDPASLNGVALTVVFSNPALPDGTVAVLDGSASQAGDSATFSFAAPLDKTISGFEAIMSLGSGHSYQDGVGPGTHSCATGQVSIVDVNAQRLSSCAGNYDDGFNDSSALITVGGVGDLTDNPPNPFGAGGLDDELYNIEPFLDQGDTQMTITSSNPSQDDNLFLAIIKVTANAEVTTGTPPPTTAPPTATPTPTTAPPTVTPTPTSSPPSATPTPTSAPPTASPTTTVSPSTPAPSAALTGTPPVGGFVDVDMVKVNPARSVADGLTVVVVLAIVAMATIAGAGAVARRRS